MAGDPAAERVGWGEERTPTVMPIHLSTPMDENPLAAEFTVIFMATYRLFGTLTPKRLALIEQLKRHVAMTVYALAKWLHRGKRLCGGCGEEQTASI